MAKTPAVKEIEATTTTPTDEAPGTAPEPQAAVAVGTLATAPLPTRPVPTNPEEHAWQILAEVRGDAALAELDAGLQSMRDRLGHQLAHLKATVEDRGTGQLAALLLMVVTGVRDRRDWTGRRARLLELLEPGTDHTPPPEPPVVDEVRTLLLAAWGPDALARGLQLFCDQRRAGLERQLPEIQKQIGHLRVPLAPGQKPGGNVAHYTAPHSWHDEYVRQLTPLLAKTRELANRIALLADDKEGIARAAADAAAKAVRDAGGPGVVVRARIDQLKVSGAWFNDDELTAARDRLAAVDTHLGRLGVDATTNTEPGSYAADLATERPTAEARVKELESATERRRTAEVEDLVSRVMAGNVDARLELAQAVSTGARTYPRDFAATFLAAAFTEASPLTAALGEVEAEAAEDLARLKAGLRG